MKDVKKSRERHARNIAVKSKIKTFVKKARTAIAGGDEAVVRTAVSAAISVTDKAAEKGIIHKNAASRRKSRLMRAAAKAKAAA
jgi:small subunit ribosomal protein S20